MSKQEILNKLIFNKYRIEKLIYSSDFASVYQGIKEKQNTPVAIKLERKNIQKNLLESEAYLLMILKGYGIPKIITYGHHGLFNVLIEEMLGKSLGYIYDSIWDSKLKIKDICMIALQCLDRLEYIHSKFVIHRDIKPQNFVIGRNDPNVIYIIDFGLSRKYRSSRTGKHIRFNNLKLTYGSLRYLSINGNRGYEQSRRDDLESLGYMLIFLATGGIPWLKEENLKINIVRKYMLIYKIKKSIDNKTLCKGLPEEFSTYLDYAKGLYFEEDPDYNYLRSLFTNILVKMKLKNDLKFSWISNDVFCKYENERNNSKNNKSYRKSTSPHIKLLDKIEQSLKAKKNEGQIKNINNYFLIDNKNNAEIKENKDLKINNNNKNEILLTDNDDKKVTNISKNIESDSTKEKDIKGLIIQKRYSIRSLEKEEKNKNIKENKKINNKKLSFKNKINKVDNLPEDFENKVKNIQIFDEEHNKYYEFNYQFNSKMDVNEQYEKNIALNNNKDLYEKNIKSENILNKDSENKNKDKNQEKFYKKIKFIANNIFWDYDKNENEEIEKSPSKFFTYNNASLINFELSDYYLKNNLIKKMYNRNKLNFGNKNTINLCKSNKTFEIKKYISNYNFNNNNINNFSNKNNLVNMKKNNLYYKNSGDLIFKSKINNIPKIYNNIIYKGIKTSRKRNLVNNTINIQNNNLRQAVLGNLSYQNSQDGFNFNSISNINNSIPSKIKNYFNFNIISLNNSIDSMKNINMYSFNDINPKINLIKKNNKRYINNLIIRKKQQNFNHKLIYNNSTQNKNY